MTVKKNFLQVEKWLYKCFLKDWGISTQVAPIKVLSVNQMICRLPTILAHIEADNTSSDSRDNCK